MSDLRELYQSVILDHNRAPRNYGVLAGATSQADGHNPLCGDAVTVWVKLAADRILDVHFVGEGCAISKASASLMTTVMKGRTRADASDLLDDFQVLVTGRSRGGAAPGESRAPEVPVPGESGAPPSADHTAALGRLAPLSGVSRYPERVKCATLAWHALRSALDRARAISPDAAAPPATAADG